MENSRLLNMAIISGITGDKRYMRAIALAANVEKAEIQLKKSRIELQRAKALLAAIEKDIADNPARM